MITSEILGVRASPKGVSPALKIDLHREPNSPVFAQIPVDISHILGNLITVIFDYQILRKPLKILSL